MEIKFNELTNDLQKEVKSILQGNGLKVSDADIFKDGKRVTLYVRKLDTYINVNF